VDVEVDRSVGRDSDDRSVGETEGWAGSVAVDSRTGGFVTMRGTSVDVTGVGDEQAWRMRDRIKKRKMIF